jgi:DNA-binding NtrC family response regulator
MASLSSKVLLVSDDADSAWYLEILLTTRLGCDVTKTLDKSAALRLANNPEFKLVVVDIQRPANEQHFAKLLDEQKCDVPVLFYSNDPPPQSVQKRFDLISEFIQKSKTNDGLVNLIRDFLWITGESTDKDEGKLM